MLRPYSCPLLVGAKHLEDKLSVIAKNISPNASPVPLSVVKKFPSVPCSLFPIP
ncbi:hypothetical protein [Dolichospermum sp. UHCC 0260]|uniref:hypothetical protein n=1 Tax=Dolichospermum sp. UHCC 0260 TaxID=2590025 RepID=UPI0020C46711|nr:hypothetical protein [Dolichospermum sp. UHCC 0260]